MGCRCRVITRDMEYANATATPLFISTDHVRPLSGSAEHCQYNSELFRRYVSAYCDALTAHVGGTPCRLDATCRDLPTSAA